MDWMDEWMDGWENMISRIATAIKNSPNSVLCHLYLCDPSSNFLEENKVNCENKID